MATRWGIVSAGKISHDFVTAVRSSPKFEENHKFVAVAARSLNSAEEFAARHGIAKEVVYIGTINSFHYTVGKLMLEHGKHVLMEKPMTLNLKQTKNLVEIARKNKCFLMEAIWSRFLPSYTHLIKLLKDKTIGDIVHVSANFGKQLTHLDRIMKKSEGGGCLLDLGIYTLNAINVVYGGENPEKIAAVGHLNEDGVDIAVTVSFQYSNKRTAHMTTNALADLPNSLVITGTKGYIRIPDNIWCATTIQTDKGKLEFPLPKPIMPCNFENSSGLMYEAMEVRKCLKEGKLESAVMPLKDSEMLAGIMDEIRQQIGVVFDEDK